MMTVANTNTNVKIVPSVLMKHAQKITKTVPGTRPTLKGVFHDVDGSMTVTNSYYLWRVENAHAYPTPIIIDPVTMQTIDGNYPETKRLIPDPEEAQAKWEVNLDKYTLGLLKSLKEVGRYEADKTIRKKDKVLFHIQRNTLSLYQSIADVTLPFEMANLQDFDNSEVDVYVNAAYLINTLEWLADELGERATVPVYYYGEYRPILLYHERAKAIIMPARIN